jgi:hypothetical protein
MLSVPATARSDAPVPLTITMTADMETYRRTDGILDDALTVIAVRRDRPAVRMVAKLDPRALMMPNTPLPPMDPSIGGRISEQRVLDLNGFGLSHPGQAEYFIVAGFADAVSEVQRLRITHQDAILPAPPCATLARAEQALRNRYAAPGRQGLQVDVSTGALPAVAGVLRQPAARGAPFLCIIALPRSSMHEASAAVFQLPAERSGEDNLAWFQVPLSRLVPAPTSGRWTVLVFAGDERSGAIDVLIP